MTTLAKRLSAPAHHSLLLRKASRSGLHGVPALIGLAVARGCLHYQGGSEPVPSAPPSRTAFSDEELAIALLSPCLPYSPRAVRVGAQMLGSRGNQPRRLALLARRERAEAVVRYLAAAGQQSEPHELFWQELLAALPAASLRFSIPPGVLPHPSRFRSEAGRVCPSIHADDAGPAAVWLRPSPVPAT
ncbi:MAG: hypothetical protein INR62_05300 [Rhodospirillales bacterium]|nr:hypothetical protein [Acetobacter sp.]